MKQIILTLFISLFIGFTVNAQVIVLEENFEDQDLTQNPEWTGDLDDFTFVDEDGNTLLRLDAEADPTRTQIRTVSGTTYGSWEFFYRPEFDASNLNRAFIFLMADQEDLNYLDGSNVNGYAIRTGENGEPKQFRLMRFNNGNQTEILASDTEIQEGQGYQIRVTRSEDGDWQIYVGEGYESTPVADSPVVNDNTHTGSSFFGLFLRYTAGNVTNFYFDNIIIESSEDFVVTDAFFSSPQSIDLVFNYPIDENSLATENFSITEAGEPQQTELISDFNVRLTWDQDFDDGDYTLTINNVEDVFGNVIEPDTQIELSIVNPFRLVELRLVDESQLELELTEEVVNEDLITASFDVDGTNPSSVTQTAAGILLLEFADPFSSGMYTLEIAPIRSVNNWTLPESDRSPVFVITEEAEPGDIVINEFFYRVPIEWRTPEFDRPRYIELYNNSDKIISLSNWTFNNEVFAGNSALAIEPDQLVVITRGEPVFIDRFGDRGYHEADNFPTLPLTTQSEIVLRNQDGMTVDSLFYTASGWGGNGVALERRDPNAPTHFVENWGESPNPLLGTPGEPNEVEPDTEPPVWEMLTFLSSAELLLVFDERIDESTASDPATYSISPDVPVDQIVHDVNEVRLLLTEDLIDNQFYDVTIENISDIFGNSIESETRSIQFLEFADPEPQELVINEILFRRLTSDSHQFIEIFNRTDDNFNLSGWTLSDATGSSTIPAGATLAANDFIVFTGSEAFAATSEKIIRVPGFRSYNTTIQDAVILRDDDGVTIDSLTYQPAWAGNEPGVSLERKDPGAISIDPANWAPSTAEGGSTPAAQNSVFEIDETAPEIIFANLFHPDSVEVRFSEYVNLGQAVQKSAYATLNTQFLIAGLEVDLIKYDPLRANRIVLDGSGIQGGEELILSIENFEDFQGNLNSGQSQPVAQPASPGDLVFNEIMFNPLADPRDNIPDQTEYLEIINRQPYAISMEGMFIHDEPDENDQVTSIVPENSSMKWIPAEGYFLLYPESTTDQFAESKIAIFFDLDEELVPHTFRFNRSTLSLPNAGRQVYLADSTQTTIDMVHYSPDWHNPNLIDSRGIALERIDPAASTNDASNWGSNTRTEGGTPLAQNSIFQVPATRPDDTGIVMEPNPFSPDGDGFEDNLFINYKFDEPDYLLRVRIYDRYGRLVRNLAEAHPAGFEGSLIWDGRTDDGLQNRIGIYIVYIEAYNSASGRNRNFRETVVIARQF